MSRTEGNGMSAVKDFREELAAALAEALGEVVSLPPSPADVRAAVRKATRGWSAVKQVAASGDHPPYEGTERRQYVVTTRPRPLTDEERAEVRRREELSAWSHGPDRHREEPPDGVGVSALLEQSRWWVSSDNRKTRVKDMHPRHRANTLAFLRRNAVELYDSATSSAMLGGGGMFEPPDEVVNEWVRSLGDRKAADDWLDEQPLIRKLRKLRKLVRRDRRAGLLERQR